MRSTESRASGTGFSCGAALRDVSLEMIVDRARISSGAAYISLRKRNRTGDRYTDTAISQTNVLVDGFEMDLDEDVTGTPAPRRTLMAKELADILSALLKEAKDQSELETVSKNKDLRA